jgi:hypothetical protein
MKYIIGMLSVLVLTACKQNQSYNKIEPIVAKNEIHKIEVIDVENGGDYLYLNVNEGDKSYWMAIPSRTVTKGETYYYNGGMLMKDFESKHLKKSFDKIIFADGIRSVEKEISSDQKSSEVDKKGSNDIVEDNLNIDKLEGGVSLEELIKDKNIYATKLVKIRGKVVKINNGILDKNWIHISDGTSFDNKKSITVTSQEMVKVGDTVSFEANLTLNKDFGYGYIYDILLENGKLIP